MKKMMVAFVSGAIVGGAVAWYVTKVKMEQEKQEDIESVKSVLARKEEKLDQIIKEETEKIKKETEEKAVKNQYDKIIHNYNKSEGSEKEIRKPYVIPPEDFGSIKGYDEISLYFYADGVLADENDCIVEDVDIKIGINPKDHFGEYEDDSVFVRNDKMRVDYEILLEQRRYSDVVKSNPRLMEDE